MLNFYQRIIMNYILALLLICFTSLNAEIGNIKKAPVDEKKIIKRLQHLQKEGYSDTTNISWELIDTLGNLKTTNKDAIALLLESMSAKNYRVAEHSINALIEIGDPVVDDLITHYKKQDTANDNVKIYIVQILGFSQAKNKTAFNFLKNIKTSNTWILDAIDDAFEEK